MPRGASPRAGPPWAVSDRAEVANVVDGMLVVRNRIYARPEASVRPCYAMPRPIGSAPPGAIDDRQQPTTNGYRLSPIRYPLSAIR